MDDRPMIFSAPMVRALLDGRKTQTRRIVKAGGVLPDFCGAGGRGSPDWNDPTCWGWEAHNYGDWISLERTPGQRMGWRDLRTSPRPGDRIWVREAWTTRAGLDEAKPREISPQQSIGYLADTEEGPWHGRPRSPIHMPRWASRITLTVTGVRVQRVQDISEGDARAEGLVNLGGNGATDAWWVEHDGLAKAGASPTHGFRLLWSALHGPGAWERNDWVAALTFDVSLRNIDA